MAGSHSEQQRDLIFPVHFMLTIFGRMSTSVLHVSLTIVFAGFMPEPEANNCFSINTQVIISKKEKKKNISTRNHLHLQWRNDYWQPFCPSR